MTYGIGRSCCEVNVTHISSYQYDTMDSSPREADWECLQGLLARIEIKCCGLRPKLLMHQSLYAPGYMKHAAACRVDWRSTVSNGFIRRAGALSTCFFVGIGNPPRTVISYMHEVAFA